MPIGASDLTLWDDRISRARRLAKDSPDAADLLTFYASLAEYQAWLLKTGSDPVLTRIVNPAADEEERRPYDLRKNGVRPRFRDHFNTRFILSAIPDLLSWLQQNAPAALAAPVSALQTADSSRWRMVLDSYLDGHRDERETGLDTFVVEAVVQPFAEQLAKSEKTPRTRIGSSESRCTNCGGTPVLGILREEGHGAKRSLLCGLCLTEQEYLRVMCPACDEQRFDALPIFTADRFDHVRIEACDSCRTYLKTIDLTKDGTAVPVVDDLASVSLDLWARDHGYQRLRPNLLRV